MLGFKMMMTLPSRGGFMGQDLISDFNHIHNSFYV
jgi:hypothetical protein